MVFYRLKSIIKQNQIDLDICHKKRILLATKTNEGEVHIFDYHKHDSIPKDSTVKPDLRLTGHTGT